MTGNNAYFVLCIQDRGNDLVAAECAALTGTIPAEDGFARCAAIDDVGRAAYIRFGASLLAHSPGREGLLCQIAELKLQAEAFRIEIDVLPGGEALPSRETVTAIADLIDGDPDLMTPQRRFALVSRRDGFWFGEILETPNGSWKWHDSKPLRTSSSLPSRLCRAIVNLAVRPGDIVLNPCCGTGSFLLEAASIGACPHGLDWNPRMVRMSRHNLAHFGYEASVELAHARGWERSGDVLLADLPYDRNCKTTEANIRGILSQTARLAPRAVFVAELDLSQWLSEAGWPRVTVYRVPKTRRFTRFVHHVQT